MTNEAICFSIMDRNFSGQDISVIIPTYNTCRTIGLLIKSILNQVPLPYEIIVVDDKSTDKTVEIVKNYPVTLIQQEKNGGPAKARNRGIKEAKGEIILFLDSDTYLMPDVIKSVLEGFNNNKNIYAQNGWCLPEPLNKGNFPLYKSLVESCWADDVPDGDNSNKCINARIGAFIKLSLVEMGGFDENYQGVSVEDHEFGLRYASKYKLIFNKRLMVKHEFPTFFQTIKNYWQRTYETMELMIRYKDILDKGGVSKSSAIQSLTGTSLLIFAFLSIFSSFFIIPLVLVFILFIFSSKKILKKLFGKGLLFGIYGSSVHIFLGLVVTSSVIFFYICLLMKKQKR